MGKKDRLVRLSLAIILLILAYVSLSWILLIAAGFVLFEALFSWCAFYQIIGKNTCPINYGKKGSHHRH